MVVMLSIVVGVALPVYNKIMDESKAGTAQNTLRLMKHARQTYQAGENYDLVISKGQGMNDSLWNAFQLMNPNKIHQQAGYLFYNEDSNPDVLGVAERSDGKKYRIYKTGEIVGDSGLPTVH